MVTRSLIATLTEKKKEKGMDENHEAVFVFVVHGKTKNTNNHVVP